MTTPFGKPNQVDLKALSSHLAAMRDALVKLSLALHDHQFACDSDQHRDAEQEARLWIDRARDCKKPKFTQ